MRTNERVLIWNKICRNWEILAASLKPNDVFIYFYFQIFVSGEGEKVRK